MCVCGSNHNSVIHKTSSMANSGVGEKEQELIISYGFVKPTNILVPPTTTLASIESLTFPLVQQVVILADFKCQACQKRVADIISRMNGETESVEVSVFEKEVTLTFTSTIPRGTLKAPEKQAAGTFHNPITKFARKRLFHLPTAR